MSSSTLQERTPEKKGRVKQIDVRNVEFEFVRKVEGENKLYEQNLTILSEPCTPHKTSVAEKLVKSAGGTPVQGLEEIIPATWVPGPLTHVQRMSPNSAALALLTGFAEGSIQMQGGTVKHLSEGNMGEMKQVMIELIQLDGKLIDKIENVNFLDRSGQSELVGEELLEIEIKQNVDSNLYSMGKEKKGKNPDKLSPAAEKRKKAAEAREKKKKKLEEERLEKERVEKEKMEEELRQKEEIKKKKQQEKTKKPKPPPKSGLSSVKEHTRSSPKLKKNLPAPEQPTRSSPRSSRTSAQTGGGGRRSSRPRSHQDTGDPIATSTSR